MPQPFNNAIMTNGGARLLTRAQAGEIKIEFTRIAIGSGKYTAAEKALEALQARTELKEWKNSYPLSDIDVYSDHSVKVTALITNQDPVTKETLVNQGYYINEMGLYAKPAGESDDAEVLYSVTVTAGENGDFMPPYNGYNPAQIIQDYFATVDNSLNVTINTAGAALLAQDAHIIQDDTTKLKYKLGIDNGKLYCEELSGVMEKRVNIAQQDTLEEVLSLLETEAVYGFIEHNNILSPDSRIEYIGANKYYTPLTVTMGGGFSLNGWVDFPVLKANKPYMVKADGTPDYRLDENDYTKKEDGSASDVANTSYNGGAFSWLMKIYKWEYMAGDDRYVLFRFEKADGFEPVGFLDPDNKELEGVWLPMFYGSIVSDKMRSISDVQPDYSKTTAAQKTAIDAFGSRAKFLGGPIVETIIDLLMMFAKTTNLQTAYGCGNMSGYDANLEPTYGVRNAIVGGGQFYGTSDGQTLNKIFHSIVLGSYNQWMRDPYEVVVNGRVKVSKNYTYDVTGAAYSDTGINVENRSAGNGWSYPHRYQTVPGYGSIPVAPYNGSTSTGGCDGLYRHASQTTITAVALRFGLCNLGRNGGPRARNWGNSAGYAYWSLGTAILLLPPVGVAA